MALEREVGRIDLQQKAVLHDRLVLDLQRIAQRGEIGVERVVVLVAHRRGDDAGGGRIHECLDESARILVEHGLEIAALVVDRARVEIAHVADRLR